MTNIAPFKHKYNPKSFVTTPLRKVRAKLLLDAELHLKVPYEIAVRLEAIAATQRVEIEELVQIFGLGHVVKIFWNHENNCAKERPT